MEYKVQYPVTCIFSYFTSLLCQKHVRGWGLSFLGHAVFSNFKVMIVAYIQS